MTGRALARRALAASLAAGCAGGALAGCGGSKPAYCSDVSDVKTAIAQLKDAKPVENGVSSLTKAADGVKSAGKKLVSDAKSAFPSQTDALKTSITALATSAAQLTDPGTRKAALAGVPAAAAAVQSSYDELASAVKGKCG
jgi:hypothetical protein